MSASPSSNKTYLLVYLSLMLLLAATLVAAFLPLGAFHEIASLGIALAKATLVVLFFMDLRHRTQRTRLLVLGSLLLLAVLMGLVLIDYVTRV